MKSSSAILASLPSTSDRPTTTDHGSSSTEEKKTTPSTSEKDPLQTQFAALKTSLEEFATSIKRDFICDDIKKLPEDCNLLLDKIKRISFDQLPIECTSMLFVLSWDPSSPHFYKTTDPFYIETLNTCNYLIKHPTKVITSAITTFLQAGIDYLKVLNPEPASKPTVSVSIESTARSGLRA